MTSKKRCKVTTEFADGQTRYLDSVNQYPPKEFQQMNLSLDA